MTAAASTHITNIRVFDGENVRPERSVTIEGTTIAAVGSPAPEGAAIVDGAGGTLLPGLIDGHAHPSLDALRLARAFGVTTELEMMGFWTPQQRAEIAEDDDIADVRTALAALMAKDGHPSPLLAELGDDFPAGEKASMPAVSTPDEAVAHVQAMVAAGADYIKVMIEDGDVLGLPGLPLIDDATLRAGVDEAHRLDRQVIAHALTEAATRQAIDAGVDGLAHLFFDRPHTEDIVAAIARRGMFVTPCLVFTSSMMGTSGAALADDPRVAARLPGPWLDTLRGSHGRFPQGRLDDVLASVAALTSSPARTRRFRCRPSAVSCTARVSTTNSNCWSRPA